MQFDLRRIDIYRKIPKDLTEPTHVGGIVSLLSIVFVLFLMTTELVGFLAIEVVNEVVVDLPNPTEKIAVFMNMSVPGCSCDVLGLDIEDEAGRHDVGFTENVDKQSINNGAGCRMAARFHINKVPGNFHVSTHAAGMKSIRKMSDDDDDDDDMTDDELREVARIQNPDMQHYIHALRFGSDMSDLVSGSFGLLADRDMLSSIELFSHEYILRLVPTTYHGLGDTYHYSYQYTWVHKEYLSLTMRGPGNPVIWFHYEINPITVRYTERRRPLYQFITTFCAIVGGTFTVSGIIDSILFSAQRIIKKVELGKQG